MRLLAIALLVLMIVLAACAVGAPVVTTPGASPLGPGNPFGRTALPVTLQVTIPLGISMYMLQPDEWLTVVCPLTQTIHWVDGSLAGSGPQKLTLDCE